MATNSLEEIQAEALAELRALLARGESVAEKIGVDMVVKTYVTAGVQFGLQRGAAWPGVVRYLRHLAERIEHGKPHSAEEWTAQLAALGAKQVRSIGRARAEAKIEREKLRDQRLAALTDEIRPLVAQGMKNELIFATLMEREASPYSKSTTVRHVKTIAAKLRAKRG